MAFEREHDRECFFKYVTIDTARLIFENETLRWSSPLLFNDPFDIQAGFHWDFDINDLPEMMLARIENLIQSDDPLVFVETPNAEAVIAALREAVKKVGLKKDKLRELLVPVYQKFAAFMESERVRYLTQRDGYLKTLRILCLSEAHDNILMWSHYADYHRGIVIKLKVADDAEDDDPFWLARRVLYSSKASPHAEKKDFVDQCLGLKKRTMYNPGDYWKWAYEKFDVWKYEAEWRVNDPSDEQKEAGYFYKGFNLVKKLEAVYFGCNCFGEHILEIISMLKAKNPDIKYFIARKHEFEYKLEFEEVIGDP